jgi:hypothetical protein
MGYLHYFVKVNFPKGNAGRERRLAPKGHQAFMEIVSRPFE